MGSFIALLIIGSWFLHLLYTLFYMDLSFADPWLYLHVLIQAYLYTGLFITGHDAMHRSVSRRRWMNNATGYLSVFLFAGMSYRRLTRNHWEHHRFPGTAPDPDFCMRSQNFFIWWYTFLARYTTLWQILAMAAIFNILHHLAGVSVPTLLVCWILPALLSTFQLFYFGTFIPHRRPHTADMGKHRARSQNKNHLWAMLSCYFFGYHREHHDFPGTPWWQLYQVKNRNIASNDA